MRLPRLTQLVTRSGVVFGSLTGDRFSIPCSVVFCLVAGSWRPVFAGRTIHWKELTHG